MKLSKAKRRANIAPPKSTHLLPPANGAEPVDKPMTFTDEQRNLIAVAVHESKLGVLNRIIDFLSQVRDEVTVNA